MKFDAAVLALVGKPRSARAVGRVMRNADGVPWHRVVNSQGGISRRARMTGMVTQRIRLEQEGIVFRRGRVVLRRFRWDGGAAGHRAVARAGRRRGFDPDALAESRA